LVSRVARELAALQQFVELQERMGAHPLLQVVFLRESYKNNDGTAWLTFDRQVTCEPDLSCGFTTQSDQPRLPFGHDVLVKLKYRERFPDWFRELVRTFGLTEDEWDKYLQSLSVVTGCTHRRVRPV